MSRKERRAANKRRDESAKRPNALAFGLAGVSIVDLAAEASRLYLVGRTNEAQEICRQILAREPAHVLGLTLLGLMAQASGNHRAAIKMFVKAIASDEVNATCHYNLGNSYQALGNRTKAITHFSKALALGMDEKAVAFILQSPIIVRYVTRIAGKWPLPITNVELFGAEGVIPLATDLFLRCAMEATTLPSVQLEVLLGHARDELLRLVSEQGEDHGEIDDDLVAFACALAQQCFRICLCTGRSGKRTCERTARSIAAGPGIRGRHNSTDVSGSCGLFPTSCHAFGRIASAPGLACDRGRPVAGATPRAARGSGRSRHHCNARPYQEQRIIASDAPIRGKSLSALDHQPADRIRCRSGAGEDHPDSGTASRTGYSDRGLRYRLARGSDRASLSERPFARGRRQPEQSSLRAPKDTGTGLAQHRVCTSGYSRIGHDRSHVRQD